MLIKSEYSLNAILNARNIEFQYGWCNGVYIYELNGSTPVATIENLKDIISESVLSITDNGFMILLTVKQNYDMFMDQVDRILAKQIGLISDDLEDYDWMAEFESNNKPGDAVHEFVTNLDIHSF